MSCQQSLASPLIRPDILAKVQEEAFEDFPRTSDILAIIHIESRFNPKARNKTHQGLMQVHNGSYLWDKNIEQGVRLLRSLYLQLGSKEKAVKSYHVGIGNVLKNKLTKSSDIYYSKFKNQRRVYNEQSFKEQLEVPGNGSGSGTRFSSNAEFSSRVSGPSYSGVQYSYETSGEDLLFGWYSESGVFCKGAAENLREDLEVLDAYISRTRTITFGNVSISDLRFDPDS